MAFTRTNHEYLVFPHCRWHQWVLLDRAVQADPEYRAIQLVPVVHWVPVHLVVPVVQQGQGSQLPLCVLGVPVNMILFV